MNLSKRELNKIIEDFKNTYAVDANGLAFFGNIKLFQENMLPDNFKKHMNLIINFSKVYEEKMKEKAEKVLRGKRK